MQSSGSQRKRKLNNKGMSLVEVMIGIVILGIASGVLLRSFVVAMQANKSAKEKQRTTTAAQSIMEGFKAYDIEELCRQFSGVIDADGNYSNPYVKVMANVGSAWEEVIVDEEGAPVSDGRHIFVLKDISFESKLYDARVEVVPKSEWTKDMAEFEAMNSYLDAVYIQPADQDRGAYDAIQQRIINLLSGIDERFSLEDFQADNLNIDKKTTVIIESPSEGVCVVTVKTVYDYEYAAGDFTYIEDDGNVVSVPFGEIIESLELPETCIYDNTSTGAPLENIYLYYYPAYEKVTGVNTETITLQNDSGEEQNIYLIKQVNAALSNIKLTTYENLYEPIVTGTGGNINLYHNLNDNLAGGSNTATVTISGVTEMAQIVENNPEYLVYEVIVSIYKDGTVNKGVPWDEDTAPTPLLQLNGSMNK